MNLGATRFTVPENVVRRNRIGTVVVTLIGSADADEEARTEAATKIVSEEARAS